MSEIGFNGWIQRRGWVEVIVGGMFSGKTEELIRRLRRAELARQKIQVFKPQIDTRYSVDEVCSHNQTTLPSIPIQSADEIWSHLDPKTQVVGIDEGQFFDHSLVDVVQALAERGLRVVIAGLDTDWQAQPFEPMPTLMAIAENVTKQHAVCVVCGGAASRTQRTAAVEGQVVVGAHDVYEARCREHFRPEVVPPTEISGRGPDPEPIPAPEAIG
ncbi:MAG: thymidine kinase [Pseudobdellovibrionaceae bacterium]